MTKVYRSTPETFSSQTLNPKIKALREWSQEQHRGGQRQSGLWTSHEVSIHYGCGDLEYTHGSGGRMSTAGNVLLAALVDEVLDRDCDDEGDCNLISFHANIERLG